MNPMPPEKHAEPQPVSGQVGLGPQPDPPPFPGDSPILRKKAQDESSAQLPHTGLPSNPEWKNLLENTEPATPMLVERLDKKGQYYYIVPQKTTNPQAAKPVAVSVDARSWELLSVVGATDRTIDAIEIVNIDSILQDINNKDYKLGEDEKSFTVRTTGQPNYVLYPNLVWKPCVESFSPFYPFHKLDFDPTHSLYIRIDGEVVPQLHDDVAGA